MTAIETIVLEQADLIDKLAQFNKKLVEELAQYRACDKEEKVLEEALTRMGGGKV